MAKQHSKSITRSSQLQLKSLRPFLTVTVILGVLIVAWTMFRSFAVHQADRTRLQEEVSSVIDKTIFKEGVPIYADISDRGCNDKSSVGLAVYVYCEMAGYKFYKTNESPQVDLRQMDVELASNGWSRGSISGKALEGSDSPSRSGSGYQVIGYMRDDLTLTIYSKRYKGEGKTPDDDSTIGDLIANGRLAHPRDDEFIFGVAIVVEYWSCRGGAFLNPCVLPPSKLE